MIRINLLPFRAARRKENVRRQIYVFFLFLFIVTAALIYTNMFFQGKVDALSTSVKSTKVALAAKKKQAAEVDRIQKELALLKKKTEVIENLAYRRKEAVVLMDMLSKLVIEKRMWFVSLQEKGNSLDIRGVALDNKTVADFMTRVEKSEIFQNVRLESTKKMKIGDYDNLKSFVVTFNRLPLSELLKGQEEAKKS